LKISLLSLNLDHQVEFQQKLLLCLEKLIQEIKVSLFLKQINHSITVITIQLIKY